MVTRILAGLLVSFLGVDSVAAQPVFVRNLGAFVVAVGPETEDLGTAFNVTWSNGQAVEFIAPDVFGPEVIAGSLWQYNNQRLVIEVENEVVIVDPLTGVIVDRFMTLLRKRSPDGRFIAIQRFSANGVEFLDSVVSAYDLQKTPGQNRASGSSRIGVGRILYPQSNVVAQSYSVATQAEQAHNLISPFVWLDGGLLAFLSHYQSDLKVVLLNVAGNSGNDTALDRNLLLKSGVPAAAVGLLRVTAIELTASNAATVTLRITFEPSTALQATTVVFHAAFPQ